MNVLVINGSPKGNGSNSIKLAQAFVAGAGWTNPEYITVAERDISPCRGCFGCWSATPGACVIKDDMTEILEKICGADYVIWAFPLYYFSVPGILKNLIDRQLPMLLPFMDSEAETGGHPMRYDLSGQKHVVLSTCGFWNAEGNYGGVTEIFTHWLGKDRYESIFCGQGELFTRTELKGRTEEYLDVVKKAGAEYIRGGIKPETKARLEETLFPRKVFEDMADASWGVDRRTNEKVEDALILVRQIAALYVPDGKKRVLEFHFTDVGKSYQILMDKDGATAIDEDLQQCTTRIETPYKVWRDISMGKITGQVAMYERKYKVTGDFEVMLRWDDLFLGGNASGSAQKEEKPEKTSMVLLLAPWIILWALLRVNATVAAVAGIFASVLVPLAYVKYKSVVFEHIGAVIVSALSMWVLFGGDVGTILTLSYALFGAMWIVTVFSDIPITSYYSAEGYGGSSAFGNPIFILTNRILTAMWGVGYVIISIITFAFTFSLYLSLVNTLIVLAMGIFTLWFQKWYPVRRAMRGR